MENSVDDLYKDFSEARKKALQGVHSELVNEDTAWGERNHDGFIGLPL